MDAQREMHKNLDLHQKRIKKEIDEFESLLKEDKFWEIIYKKDDLKNLKKKEERINDEFRVEVEEAISSRRSDSVALLRGSGN